MKNPRVRYSQLDRVWHDFPFSGTGLPDLHVVVGPSERREREGAEDILKVA